MREYELLATQETRAALALLGRPWVHHTVSRDHVEVRLLGGATVVIGSEARDLDLAGV